MALSSSLTSSVATLPVNNLTMGATTEAPYDPSGRGTTGFPTGAVLNPDGTISYGGKTYPNGSFMNGDGTVSQPSTQSRTDLLASQGYTQDVNGFWVPPAGTSGPSYSADGLTPNYGGTGLIATGAAPAPTYAEDPLGNEVIGRGDNIGVAQGGSETGNVDAHGAVRDANGNVLTDSQGNLLSVGGVGPSASTGSNVLADIGGAAANVTDPPSTFGNGIVDQTVGTGENVGNIGKTGTGEDGDPLIGAEDAPFGGSGGSDGGGTGGLAPPMQGNGEIIGGPGYVDATSKALTDNANLTGSNLRDLSKSAIESGTNYADQISIAGSNAADKAAADADAIKAAGQTTQSNTTESASGIVNAGQTASDNAGNAASDIKGAATDAGEYGTQQGSDISDTAKTAVGVGANYGSKLSGLEETEGPSAAQATLQTGINAAQDSNLALARSGHGWGGGASNLVQAQGLNAAAGQQAANQAAILRANENAAWRARQAANLGAAGNLELQGIDTGVKGMKSGADTGLAGKQLDISGLTSAGQLGLAGDTENVNARTNAGQLGLAGDTANINALSLGGNLNLQGGQTNVSANTAAGQTSNAAYNTGVGAETAAGTMVNQGTQAAFEVQKAQTEALLRKYGIDRQVDEQTLARLAAADQAKLAAWLSAGGTILSFLSSFSSGGAAS